MHVLPRHSLILLGAPADGMYLEGMYEHNFWAFLSPLSPYRQYDIIVTINMGILRNQPKKSSSPCLRTYYVNTCLLNARVFFRRNPATDAKVLKLPLTLPWLLLFINIEIEIAIGIANANNWY